LEIQILIQFDFLSIQIPGQLQKMSKVQVLGLVVEDNVGQHGGQRVDFPLLCSGVRFWLT